MNSIFITGTDTGVGKTILTATLLRSLREQGVNAAPMKPIQTGCEPGPDGLIAPDLEYCLQAADLTPKPITHTLMCPYKYKPACSPHLAAELANETIDPQKLITTYQKLSEQFDAVLVEGAGGILVPITRTYSMLDLAKELNIPIILAARPNLGTLNHTLLTIKAIHQKEIPIMGIVIIHTDPPTNDYIEIDNKKTIHEITGLPVHTLPYLPNHTSPESIPTNIPLPLNNIAPDSNQP